MGVVSIILNWIIAYELISIVICGIALGVGVYIEWIKEKNNND